MEGYNNVSLTLLTVMPSFHGEMIGQMSDVWLFKVMKMCMDYYATLWSLYKLHGCVMMAVL